MSRIVKARRSFRPLKIGLSGISGSGKTYSALKLAAGICGGDYSKVCIIDSENFSASLYAEFGEYSILPLTEFSPSAYIDAIKEAESAGFGVIIIDSASHEYEGSGGLLDAVDKIAKASRSGNTFMAWNEGSSIHKKFMDAWLRSNAHFIATFRVKSDYVMETNANGKIAPKKVGLKSIAREGTEYEFDCMLNIHQNHYCSCEKDRTGLWTDKPPFVIDESTGKAFLDWAKKTDECSELATELATYPDIRDTPYNRTITLASRVKDNVKRDQILKVIAEFKDDNDKLEAFDTRINEILSQQ